LFLLGWWIIWHLQDGPSVRRRADPVGVALLLLCAAVLASFAAAMMRGQPSDQISPAISAVLRVGSWSGVLLVTLEVLTRVEQVRRLARLIVCIAAGLAALGLAQAATGQSLLDWVSQIPVVS